jgi:hypothetical protein
MQPLVTGILFALVCQWMPIHRNIRDAGNERVFRPEREAARATPLPTTGGTPAREWLTLVAVVFVVKSKRE